MEREFAFNWMVLALAVVMGGNLVGCVAPAGRSAARTGALPDGLRASGFAQSADVWRIEFGRQCLVWGVGYPSKEAIRTSDLASDVQIAALRSGTVVFGVNGARTHVLVVGMDADYVVARLPSLAAESTGRFPGFIPLVGWPNAIVPAPGADGWLVFMDQGSIVEVAVGSGEVVRHSDVIRQCGDGLRAATLDVATGRGAFLTADGRLEIFEWDAQRRVGAVKLETAGIEWQLLSCAGAALVAHSGGSARIESVDLELLQISGRLRLPSSDRVRIALSSDDKWLATATGTRRKGASQGVDTELRIYRMEGFPAQPACEVSFAADVFVDCVAVASSPSGRPRVFVGGDRGLALEWTPRTAAEARQ